MAANSHVIDAVGIDPGSLRQSGSVKVQGITHNAFAVQRTLGRFHGLCVGSLVKSPICYRLKLHRMSAVKNNAENGIGKLLAFNAVEYHVAHSDLALQRLTSALGMDDAGELV